MQHLKLSQLISSLSYALDITEGQPEGHCIRCCWIGMHIANKLQLSKQEQWELYYVLLLKDLGCSSNASRICELYLTDDLSFKREFKWVDGSVPQVLRFLLRNTGLGKGFITKIKAITEIVKNSDELAQELIQTRCTRGAEIARQLGFPEPVSAGIHSLDEHWNGEGRPERLQGQEIPLYARIALLAQVIDIVQFSLGPNAALAEVQSRSGIWFDPELVDAFASVAEQDTFWQALGSANLEDLVLNLPPGLHSRYVDEDYLDDVAEAFGQVVDAKSPYTAGHSARVALYTSLLGNALGIDENRQRWLKRGALLHDVGKLGVSNAILDKPGKLDDDEWLRVQQHAGFTQDILGRIDIFSELARFSAAHHERLDGKGYPYGLSAEEIHLETRIITTADIFDAITAERPYRGATAVSETLEIMDNMVGTALDPDCYQSLKTLIVKFPELFPD